MRAIFMRKSSKLACVRLVRLELEVRRKPPAEGAQALQQLLSTGLAGNSEFAPTGNIGSRSRHPLELKCLDDGQGQTNR
jgi:hypothetical protein